MSLHTCLISCAIEHLEEYDRSFYDKLDEYLSSLSDRGYSVESMTDTEVMSMYVEYLLSQKVDMEPYIGYDAKRRITRYRRTLLPSCEVSK